MRMQGGGRGGYRECQWHSHAYMGTYKNKQDKYCNKPWDTVSFSIIKCYRFSEVIFYLKFTIMSVPIFDLTTYDKLEHKKKKKKKKKVKKTKIRYFKHQQVN